MTSELEQSRCDFRHLKSTQMLNLSTEEIHTKFDTTTGSTDYFSLSCFLSVNCVACWGKITFNKKQLRDPSQVNPEVLTKRPLAILSKISQSPNMADGTVRREATNGPFGVITLIQIVYYELLTGLEVVVTDFAVQVTAYYNIRKHATIYATILRHKNRARYFSKRPKNDHTSLTIGYYYQLPPLF